MGLDAYEDGRTAAEIMAQCEAMHDYPGLNLVGGSVSTSSKAFIQLNEILTDVYTSRDWPFLASATNVVISARENSLPTDYWRARFHDPLVLIKGNERLALTMLDPASFFHGGLHAINATGEPKRATIDKKRGSFYVDCSPDRSYNAELHYFRYVARLTATSDVPLYPHHSHLIQLLNAWYAQQQNDPERYQMAKAEAGEQEARIRASLWESTDDDNTLLDPRLFRRPDYDCW